MSEYGGKLAEGMYKMDFEPARLTVAQAQPMASPSPLDETSMPTFPGIESWLQVVQTSEGFELPPTIASDKSYVSSSMDPGNEDHEEEAPLSPSPSSSPKLSAVSESVRRHASGSFTAASSQSSARTSLDCDIRDDEAVSRQWEKKGEMETLEQAECNCLQVTASLLGDLGGINARSHSTALDALVAFSRDAVSKCRAAFDCPQCVSTRPANALLLCMASKYISMLYERISLSYNMMERTAKIESQYGDYNDNEDEDEDDEDDDDEAYEARKVENWNEERLYQWFTSDQKQNPHKRLQVIRCIITLQLSKFTELVTSLKQQPLKGEGCASLLTEAEGRMGRLSTQMTQAATLSAR